MRNLRRSPTARVVIALVAGFAIGTLISVSGDPALRAIAAATEPVGTMWINALRMTVIPLVVSLIVVSVGRFSDVRSAGRTGGRTFLLFAAFLVGSSLFAVLTVPTLFRWVPTGSQTTTALAQSPNSSAVREQVQHLPTVAQWFADLVPTNPIRAAADGTMLPLVIFCILFGLATPIVLQQWSIRTREFRENLEWAVVVPGDDEVTPAVAQLLEELSARGITIHNSRLGYW